MTTPYYSDELVTLYHGDCREITEWMTADVLITDPPYPNNAGHFDEHVDAARQVLALADLPSVALVFWTELEPAPVGLPLVGVHIWHRANVNGRPYEPIFHFDQEGTKRRSDVFRYAVEFENATGAAYYGHPTQKPVPLMERLIVKTTGTVADPFAGAGSSLVAAKNLGRRAIGVERDERHCETIAKRLAQGVLDFGASA